MAKKQRIPHKFQPWIDARRKFHLSHKHIQMARELGLSPKKFGSYANRDKQPWKLPLVEFIEFLYKRQFGVKEPEHVQTMEEIAAAHVTKRAERKMKKMSGESGDDSSETSDSDENTDDASDASPENAETSAVDNESPEKDA